MINLTKLPKIDAMDMEIKHLIPLKVTLKSMSQEIEMPHLNHS